MKKKGNNKIEIKKYKYKIKNKLNKYQVFSLQLLHILVLVI